MNLSKLLITTTVTSVMLITNAAFASSNLNLSKSNAAQSDTTSANAEKACIDGGGRIETNKNGQKFCVKKAQENASNATTVKGSKSNSSE